MITSSGSIPLADLQAQYLSVKPEIDKAVAKCIEDSDFIRGKQVGLFEDAFASYIGAPFCVSCGNGTDALELILRALDIGPGDEVIVPALTWIATAEAVNNTGAEPVFADIKGSSFTIDPADIEAKITNRTKAVIAVHLYGCPADMDELCMITEKNNLHLVEDCAQSHGAVYKEKKTGTFGIAAAFSFFPSKNLGAFGDAGAVVTSDRTIADKVRMTANHGQLVIRHDHRVIGRNSRLDTIQAAVLNVKLPHLDRWNTARKNAAGKYLSALSAAQGLFLPGHPDDREHVYHLFVLRHPERDNLIDKLRENKVSCSIHYPCALPFLKAYSYKGHKPVDFPVSFIASSEVLSIPMFPEISDEQIERVCHAITSA